MTREQMIEKAAKVMYGAVPVNGGDLLATAVVDALLPQVTTVEELKALPVGTIVVTAFSGSARRLPGEWKTEGCTYLYDEQMVEAAPLTVVWQP